MTLAFIAVVTGLVLLVWSADRFVEGSAVTARHFGMPALLVGMVIVGFGTSLPEMLVSALAAWQGQSRHCAWQRLRLEHQQYRPDTGTHGIDTPDRVPVAWCCAKNFPSSPL